MTGILLGAGLLGMLFGFRGEDAAPTRADYFSREVRNVTKLFASKLMTTLATPCALKE